MALPSILVVSLACLLTQSVPSHGSTIFFRGQLIRDKSLVSRLKTYGRDEKWFTQKLDHFNPSDTRQWRQLYYINKKYFRTGGPVFLQLGAESPAEPVWLQQGQIAERYAPTHGAAHILLEHRFYGQSRPTNDVSVESLKYLTKEQALADAAMFISKFKEQNPKFEHSKWIVFGGSYGGALAAWLRLKYPHLVAGAVASSAPLEAIIDYSAYVSATAQSLGPSCSAAIAQATKQIVRLLKHPEGCGTLNELFQVCPGQELTCNDDEDDLSHFILHMVFNVEAVVQYSKANRAFKNDPLTNIPIDTICDIMVDPNAGNPMERYAQVQSIIRKALKQSCYYYAYKGLIDYMKQESWDAPAAVNGRQWTWQTCREFGFFQSSRTPDQPFGDYFPPKIFIEQCQDIFGEEYNRTLLEMSIDFTNTNYGGRDLSVSNVVFVNGNIDPWHPLGRLEDLNPTSPAIFINGTSHCADTYPDSEIDPPEMRAARQRINKLIGRFLANPSPAL